MLVISRNKIFFKLYIAMIMVYLLGIYITIICVVIIEYYICLVHSMYTIKYFHKWTCK